MSSQTATCERSDRAADTRARENTLRALGENAPYARRNHALGVTAGTFASLARDFLDPELILVGLVYAVTKSAMLAALIPIINKCGALAPQLLASSFLEHLPRRRPAFVVITVVRSLAHIGMVASLALMTQGDTHLPLMLFFLAYLISCVAGGSGHVIFMDMVGRLIPADRVGSFLGMRTFLGGGLSICAGFFVVQPLLSHLPLPTNYLVLAIIGTVLVIADMSTWSLCREKDGPRARRPSSFTQSMRRGFGWLRTDWNYRCYFLTRIAFRMNYLALAFFIPYGTEKLEYEGAGGLAVLGGVMVAVRKGSTVVASGIGGRLVDRLGSRTTLICAGVFLLAAPLLALLAPLLPSVFEIPLPGADRGLDLRLCIYLLGLICIGFGMRVNMLGGQRFLITSAPPHRRASYIAFLNTITTPLTFLPLAGAWIGETFGMSALFVAVVFGGGVLALVSALRMTPDAGTPRSAPDAAG